MQVCGHFLGTGGIWISTIVRYCYSHQIAAINQVKIVEKKSSHLKVINICGQQHGSLELVCIAINDVTASYSLRKAKLVSEIEYRLRKD